MIKKIAVYDHGTCVGHYILNTIQSIELINKLLTGTNYDIIITNQEE